MTTKTLQWAAPLSIALALAWPVAAQDRSADRLSSIGAPEAGELMDALMSAYARRNPAIGKGRPWLHRSDSQAIGALMFARADMAPMVRPFTPAELAPYDHQFRGDMMKAPVMVPIALREGKPVWIAVNRRPGSPLESDVRGFLDFALSPEGQTVASGIRDFTPLAPEMLGSARRELEGFVASLDPAIPAYRSARTVSGEISSVGSDGMKSLMERWMDGFIAVHPGVRRGERWEHLGTLNGFHALLLDETDLAPMGRELWPQERNAYLQSTGVTRPLEIRVARGGFNTPQRTTAQAVFVHADNPVKEITLPQMRAIYSEPPAITHWGELGATGEWANRPIRPYMPPPASPNAMSIQISLLGEKPWNRAAQAGSIAATAEAAAKDPAAIAFGGFEEGGPGLKTLSVATDTGQPAITATPTTASDGTYPLTRSMYVRLTRQPGKPLAPQVADFLRYILSREGQQAIVASGYFPLSEAELRIERAKLK